MMRGLVAVVVVLATASGVLAQDNDFSPSCKLKKMENGVEVHWDLNILSKTANDAGEASGLAANWVAGEKGHNTDRDEFEYYINICNQLVNTAEAGIPSGVGMYQRATDSNETAIGGTIAYSQLSSLRDNDLRMVFGPGDQSSRCEGSDCPNRRTIIVFFCADVGFGAPVFVDEYKHLEYLFVWNTCAACPVGNPIRDKCSPKPLDECNFLGGRSMGTGTVLILAFVIIFTFYIVVGVLYKRFVLGASGVEQIPNVDMWCGCLESISLGCSSIIGKCSGGGSKPISTYAEANLDLSESESEIESDAAPV